MAAPVTPVPTASPAGGPSGAVPAVVTALHHAVSETLADLIQDAHVARGELTLRTRPEALLALCRRLRDEAPFQFQQMVDLTAADYPERPERFEVVWHLLSLTHNHRVRIKLTTDEDTPVPSVIGIWPCAGWFEREVWDMFGVWFDGNPDLRRILTDYGFDGHPLRKDFPLTGYTEVRYDEIERRVVYEPVRLPQEFRRFDSLSPWEGMTEVMLPGDEKATRPQGPVPALAVPDAALPVRTEAGPDADTK